MSAYSLDKLNRYKYIQEFEDNILYNFDNYFYHKNFRVGKGVEDKGELQHNLIFHRILCTDNCSIINYVQRKLDGCLEPEPKKKTLTQLLHGHCCNQETTVDPLCGCRVDY